MKTLARFLLSLLLAASCCLLVFGVGVAPRRRVTKTLTLSNGIDWGEWGPVEYCADESFAFFFEAKFEQYGVLDTDETALNALKLYCVDLNTDLPTGHIMSTEGEKGDWEEMRTCSHGYVTAVRARVLEPQGTLADDVAVQNFQLECDSGEVLTAVDGAYVSERIPLGTWGDWASCPDDSAVCGLQTRYNKPTVGVDDAAIADTVMYCCALNETTAFTD